MNKKQPFVLILSGCGNIKTANVNCQDPDAKPDDVLADAKLTQLYRDPDDDEHNILTPLAGSSKEVSVRICPLSLSPLGMGGNQFRVESVIYSAKDASTKDTDGVIAYLGNDPKQIYIADGDRVTIILDVATGTGYIASLNYKGETGRNVVDLTDPGPELPFCTDPAIPFCLRGTITVAKSPKDSETAPASKDAADDPSPETPAKPTK